MQANLFAQEQGLPSQRINDNWLLWQRSGMRWLRPLMQRAAALGVEHWRALALRLLAAWIIANVARLFWLLLPLPAVSTQVFVPVNSNVGETRSSASSVDIDTMAGWHLFGQSGTQARAAVVEEQAQDTTLNLQLLGVVSASDPAQARAFILVDGQQRQFAVGEALPGSGRVVLSKVLPDRVIVDNNGRYETLWLYDPASNTQPSANNSAATLDLRANVQVTAQAQNYRQQLYQNPNSLADVIRVMPATEGGKLVGYRVNPGGDPAQFQKFGLKPGDIVTGVNGVALDDPQHALDLYNLMRSAREASIAVRRGSESMTLMVSLDRVAD